MKLDKILALPRSLILNVALFGWGGVKCPIIFSNDTKLKGIKRNKIIVDKKSFGIVSIGFQGTEGLEKRRTSIIIKEGSIRFKGKASLCSGTSIRVDAGNLVFGNEFSCNNNCFFSCSIGITFGEDVLLGWNINVRDSDGHIIYESGIKKESVKPVNIGNHVWIASLVDILKGVEIPDGCVIGYRSCLTGSYINRNSLIAGYPAREIQKNIEWKH